MDGIEVNEDALEEEVENSGILGIGDDDQFVEKEGTLKA